FRFSSGCLGLEIIHSRVFSPASYRRNVGGRRKNWGMEELHDDGNERRAERQPNLSPRSPLECDDVEFVGTWPPLQEFDDAATDDLEAPAPQFIESTYTRVLADGCSSIVDEIAEVERADARQQA